MPDRRLIVNADDFGLTQGVNAGIVEAHEKGIVTATTLMANGDAFHHAVKLAKRYPGLDVGCHLVLVEGRSVARPGRALPRSLKAFLARIAGGWSGDDIAREFRAQIEKVCQAGILPTHLDTHKHTHVVPRVLDALLRVAREFGIPWIRRPFDLPLTEAHAGGTPFSKRLTNRSLRPLQGRFEKKLPASGARCTDYFAGFQLTGRLQTEQLARLISALPHGLTEFMCHPGHPTTELENVPTRLRESRALEVEALTSTAVRQAIEEASVVLTSYEASAGA